MILLVVGAGELADGLKVALQHGDAPLLVVLADAPQQLAMLNKPRPTARNKPGNAESSAERRA